MTKELTKERVQKLIDRFKEHHEDHHSPEYSEAKTRQYFINLFFKALVWDVDTERSDSQLCREFIYKDKVRVRGKVSI